MDGPAACSPRTACKGGVDADRLAACPPSAACEGAADGPAGWPAALPARHARVVRTSRPAGSARVREGGRVGGAPIAAREGGRTGRRRSQHGARGRGRRRKVGDGQG